jgi:uncharacterized protein YjbJ (UPF0337 family)
MNMQLMGGLGHQLKGTAKAVFGRIIGDAKLVADGNAEHALGTAQSVADGGSNSGLGIDQDRLAGIGHELRGAARQGVGRLIGDAKLEADGTAERSAGKVQNAVGSMRDEARDAALSQAAPPTDDKPLS